MEGLLWILEQGTWATGQTHEMSSKTGEWPRRTPYHVHAVIWQTPWKRWGCTTYRSSGAVKGWREHLGQQPLALRSTPRQPWWDVKAGPSLESPPGSWRAEMTKKGLRYIPGSWDFTEKQGQIQGQEDQSEEWRTSAGRACSSLNQWAAAKAKRNNGFRATSLNEAKQRGSKGDLR